MNSKRYRDGRHAAVPTTSVWNGAEPLPLADGWALDWDDRQWIIRRARKAKGKIKWQPMSYIRAEKRVLMRVIERRGIFLTPEAQAALKGLNEDFEQWRNDADRLREMRRG